MERVKVNPEIPTQSEKFIAQSPGRRIPISQVPRKKIKQRLGMKGLFEVRS